VKIGIDISQLTFQKVGVSDYLANFLNGLLKIDEKNEYIFFYSSMRGKLNIDKFKFLKKSNVRLRQFKMPPTFLDFLWNRLHIFPIENLIGEVDLFITSDWTEPPAKKAKKATILYDLIVYKYPNETDSKIIKTQKRKLHWVEKESDLIFCISKSTAKDANEILGIEESRLKIAYPGIN
jgi:hypothetical protein